MCCLWLLLHKGETLWPAKPKVTGSLQKETVTSALEDSDQRFSQSWRGSLALAHTCYVAKLYCLPSLSLSFFIWKNGGDSRAYLGPVRIK